MAGSPAAVCEHLRTSRNARLQRLEIANIVKDAGRGSSLTSLAWCLRGAREAASPFKSPGYRAHRGKWQPTSQTVVWVWDGRAHVCSRAALCAASTPGETVLLLKVVSCCGEQGSPGELSAFDTFLA